MKLKKTYISPKINLVTIDRELVFLATSENTPPDLGGGGDKDVLPPRPTSGNYYEDKNKFNENPFEK